MSGLKECTEEEQDMLREIGNIGSGNAMTSLSMMLHIPFELDVPECKVIPKSLAGQMLFKPQNLYAGVSLVMDGTVDCMLALLLNEEFTELILHNLNEGAKADVAQLTEEQKSAIREVGNIMGNSYVTAVASLTGREIDVSVPQIVVDTGETILREFLSEYNDPSERFLFINTSFRYRHKKLGNYMLLCPTEESLKNILQSLG